MDIIMDDAARLDVQRPARRHAPTATMSLVEPVRYVIEFYETGSLASHSDRSLAR